MNTIMMTPLALPSSTLRFGNAWAVLWRGLLAGLCCIGGGGLVGIGLGFLVALGNTISHFPSWREAFLHSSRMLAELLAVLPV